MNKVDKFYTWGQELEQRALENGIQRRSGETDESLRSRVLDRLRDFHATNLFDDEAQAIKSVLSNGQPMVHVDGNVTHFTFFYRPPIKFETIHVDFGKIEERVMAQVASCNHVPKQYVGFTECYTYCEKCDIKLE